MKRYNVRVGIVAAEHRAVLAAAMYGEFRKPPYFVQHSGGGWVVLLVEVTRKELVVKVSNFIRGFNAAINTTLRPTVVRCNGAPDRVHVLGALGGLTPRPKRHVRRPSKSDRVVVREEGLEQEYDLGRIG